MQDDGSGSGAVSTDDGGRDAGTNADDESRIGGVSRRVFAAGAVAATTLLSSGTAAALTRTVPSRTRPPSRLGPSAGTPAHPVPSSPVPGRPAIRAIPDAPRPASGTPTAAAPTAGADALLSADPLALVPEPAAVVDAVVDEVSDPVVPRGLDDLPPVLDSPPLVSDGDLVVHVARRLTFGPTPEVVDEIRSLGPAVWIERQLRPTLVPDPEMDAALRAFPTLAWSNEQTLATRDNTAIDELRHATALRALRSRRQLFEVMVDFWTNHVNTYAGKGAVRHLKTTEDRDVVRRHALGRFRDLLMASAKSPAMLEYLDNDSSRGTNPNENYGRELLELHTLGVDGGYTEDDVRGAAYVLTGWTWDRTEGTFVFRDDWHFDGPARVLDWSTPGRRGPGAVADGESLLAHLASHPSTARFLATKLARRFVGDDPPPDVVETTARAYLDADTDISATLRHLFSTEAFRAGGTPKLRRPFDLVISTLRATDAAVDADPLGDGLRRIDRTLKGMGQRLFDQPPPTGYPDTAADWISTDGLLRRWSWPAEVLHGRVAGIVADPGALDDGAATAGELVDGLARRLLHAGLAADDRAALLGAIGATAAEPVTDTHREDLPLLAALILATAAGQHR